jgi:hypothetical protein
MEWEHLSDFYKSLSRALPFTSYFTTFCSSANIISYFYQSCKCVILFFGYMKSNIRCKQAPIWNQVYSYIIYLFPNLMHYFTVHSYIDHYKSEGSRLRFVDLFSLLLYSLFCVTNIEYN